jgi:hypothetical protein
MPHCIVRIFEPLLRRSLPARGRHRACAARPAPARADVSGPRFVHGMEVA